jgi:hypothetical protein
MLGPNLGPSLDDCPLPLRSAPSCRTTARFARLAERVWRALPSRAWKGDKIGPPCARRYPKFYRAWMETTFSKRVRYLLEGSWKSQVRRALEACIPDRKGPGHHDDRTGHKCRPGGQLSSSSSKPTDRANSDRRPSSGALGPAAPGSSKPDANRAKGTGILTAKGKHSPHPFDEEHDLKSSEIKTNAGKLRANVGNDNERRLAKLLGPDHERLPDSEPMDVVRKAKNGRVDGYEVKTFLTNRTGKIHMSPAQARRKEGWSRGKVIGITDPRPKPDPSYDSQAGRRVHVVVIDHREAYFDHVEHKADFDSRKLDNLYYARHARPWSIGEMVKCDTPADLAKLRDMPENAWKKTYGKYQGKSYPSGKNHPVVSKIVTGETSAQLHQLYQDRKAKYDHVASRLRYWQDVTARHQQDRRESRSEARRLQKAGKEASGAKATRRADRALGKARHASLSALRAELTLKRRKDKLELTAAKLQAKGEKVPA